MTVDNDRLKELIMENKLRHYDLARALGISKQTFSNKLLGKGAWKWEELEVLARMIGKDEMDKCAPGWRKEKYSVCSCLRMIRKSFLRLKTSEVAKDLGYSEESVQYYESTRIPPVSYISKFSTTYRLPCSLLLNIDEEKWEESKKDNLVMKTYEKTPEVFVYAMQGEYDSEHRKRMDMFHMVRDMIFSMNKEELDSLYAILREVEESRTYQNRWTAYREILLRMDTDTTTRKTPKYRKTKESANG